MLVDENNIAPLGNFADQNFPLFAFLMENYENSLVQGNPVCFLRTIGD